MTAPFGREGREVGAGRAMRCSSGDPRGARDGSRSHDGEASVRLRSPSRPERETARARHARGPRIPHAPCVPFALAVSGDPPLDSGHQIPHHRLRSSPSAPRPPLARGEHTWSACSRTDGPAAICVSAAYPRRLRTSSATGDGDGDSDGDDDDDDDGDGDGDDDGEERRRRRQRQRWRTRGTTATATATAWRDRLVPSGAPGALEG